MPTLNELNENSYNQLDGIMADRINNQPLFFYDLLPAEFFDFVRTEWKPGSTVNLSNDQLQLIALLKQKRYVFIPKDRGVGETLATSLYLAHEIKHYGKKIIIVAPSRDIGCQTMETIRLILNAIVNKDNDTWAIRGKQKKIEASTKYLKWYNREIVGVVTGIDELRSREANIVYLAEADFIRNPREMWNIVSCAIAARKDSQIIVSSGFNGHDSFLMKLCRESNGVEGAVIFPMMNPSLTGNDPDKWPIS